MEPTTNHINVALVLSSGGARGITQIGVIQELEARGFQITSIAGTSIGALIGALYLTGNLNAYAGWVKELKQFDVFQMMDFSISGKGLLKAKKVFTHLEKWLKGYRIEELPIPFSIIATDVAAREEVVFTRGPLLDAVRASVSIPNVIHPHAINGRYLHDGGVINPIPLNRVKRSGNEVLIAVNLNAHVADFDPQTVWGTNGQKKQTQREKAFYEEWLNKWFPPTTEKVVKVDYPGLFATTTGIIDVMQNQLSKLNIHQYPPDFLVEIPQTLCSTFEFHKSDELVAFGRKALAKALEKRRMDVQRP